MLSKSKSSRVVRVCSFYTHRRLCVIEDFCISDPRMVLETHVFLTLTLKEIRGGGASSVYTTVII